MAADEKTIGQRRIEAIQRKNIAAEVDAIKGLPKLLNSVNKQFAEDILGKFVKETSKGNLTLDKKSIAADPAEAAKLIKEFQAEGTIKAELDDLSDEVKAGFKKLGEDSKALQKRDAEGNKKFLQKLFGTPGDRKQQMAELFELIKRTPGKIFTGIGEKLKDAFSSLKDGVGTFFDIIKTGLLLIGGLAALEAFADGWSKATKFLGPNADFGDKLASGLANVIGIFTGMTEGEIQELAINLAGKFEIVGNIIKRIGEAFKNILGLGVDDESRTLGDKIKDWSIAIGLSVLFFTNIVSTMAKSVLTSLASLGKQVILFGLNLLKSSFSMLFTNSILGGSKLMNALKALRVAAVSFAMVTIPAMASMLGGMVMSVGAFLLTNPIGWIILAVAAIGALLYVFWDDIMALKKQIDDAGGFMLFMKLAWAKVTDAIGHFMNGLIDFYNWVVSKANLIPGISLDPIAESNKFTTDGAAKIREQMAANMKAAQQRDAELAAAQNEQPNQPGGELPNMDAELADMMSQMEQFNLGNMGGATVNTVAPITNVTNNSSMTTTVLRTRPGYSMDLNYGHG